MQNCVHDWTTHVLDPQGDAITSYLALKINMLLARVHGEQTKLHEADITAQLTIEVFEEKTGSQSTGILANVCDPGEVQEQSKVKAAEASYSRVLQGCKQLRSSRHELMLQVLERLAGI